MRIKRAKIEDINEIISIYDNAICYMLSIGNGNQWVNGYPSREIITRDISEDRLYICTEDGSEDILAVFCYFVGDEPTYNTIYNGEWLNMEPYGVVHRIASSGKVSRVADFCLNWCFQQHNNMRIDTHNNNTTMKSVLVRLGYIKCGTIYCSDGSERVAYHKTAQN